MMTAIAPVLLTMAAAAAAPATSQPPDGKVTGLNPDTYGTLQQVKMRNPSSLSEIDAKDIAAAIGKDGKVDAVEADLLAELTASQFRNITVTPAKPGPGIKPQIMVFPTVGNAKKVLLYALNPVPDLAAEWAKPDHGWNLLVTDYKSGPAREAAVLAFVTAELAKKWEVSNTGNGFKPLRDEIARLYGLGNSPGGDMATSRTLIYRAMSGVDAGAKGAVPDLLYNWLRPGGAL